MTGENQTTIICIDLQEKLVNMLSSSGALIKENAIKLMKAAHILNIDTIITEQYPKGLGATIKEISSIKSFKTIEKTTFSALQTQEFLDAFLQLNNKRVVIFGIETHICLYQSVIDLLQRGYEVCVVSSCSYSRNENDHKTALELMKQEGAKIMTLEMVLFDFLKSSKHPNFKEIQALIK